MFGMQYRLLGVVQCPGRVWTRGRRVFARKAVRVHLKGPAQEVQDTLKQYENLVKTQHSKGQPKNEHFEQKSQTPPSPDPDALFRSRIRYKLLSEAKDYERKLLEKVKTQKYRREHQLFVAEGYRVIREALEHGATPEAVYFTRLRLVAALKAAPSQLKLEDVYSLSDLPLFKAPYKTLQTWSSVTTSPGIVGVFKIPPPIEAPRQPSSPSLPLTIVLDEMRDPGNLGGVMRTAAAVGAYQVLLMKGCCDPWEAKVVRAGCGAHFRLSLTPKLTWDRLFNHMPKDAQIFLAEPCRGESALVDDEEDVVADTASEQGGMKGGGSSISSNVEDDIDELDNNVYELDEEGRGVMVDHSYNDPEHLELYQHVSLPTQRYDRLGLLEAEGGAVLVVGGEVGVSNAAKKFVAESSGRKVTIPLANGMDSLNAGVATGIILYEMQKQLHEVATKKLQKEKYESGG